jgi:hypothetical protein
MARYSKYPLLYNPNNILWFLQIMKLEFLVKYTSCHEVVIYQRLTALRTISEGKI